MAAVYLAGAGVSLNPPTNFPLATMIANAIVGAVSPNVETREALLDLFNSRREAMRHPGDYLRFETLMDVLTLVDPELEILDFVTLFDQPNSIHYFLADRALNGDIVITPNFDDLIEKACIDLGGNPRSICRDRDFAEAIRDGVSATETFVYKIHGSFLEYSNRETAPAKETIQSTLSTVTSGVTELVLTEGKMSFLQHATRGRRLIVAGYSGSDDLDIVPSLKLLDFESIIWLDHDGEHVEPIDITSTTVNRLSDRPPAHRSTRDEFLLEAANSNRLTMLTGVTKHFLSDGNAALETFTSCVGTGGETNRFLSFIDSWQSRHFDRPGRRDLVAATLFFKLGRREEERKYFEKAYVAFEEQADFEQMLETLNALTRTHTRQRDKEKALELSEKALELTPKVSKAFLKADTLRSAGYIQSYLDLDLDKALGYFNEAENHCNSIDRSRRVQEIYSYILHDSAMVHHRKGNFNEAIKRFNESLVRSSNEGDIRHVAYTHQQLGNIYYDQGEFAKSLEQHEKALDIASQITAAEQMANSNHEIGMISFLSGNSLEAIRRFRESLRINKLYGCEPNRAMDWQHIGIALLESGKIRAALNMLARAADEYLRHDQRQHLPELHSYIAECHLSLGDIAPACKSADRAVALSDPQEPEYRLRAGFVQALVRIKLHEGHAGDCAEFVISTGSAGFIALLMDQIHAVAKYQLDLEDWLDQLGPIANLVREKYAELGNQARLSRITRYFGC
ncbi:MAG TPA: hypothetical protein DEP46_01065 [Blastocatellia bacterium]|nr:hypothetical protein [Blastocatellia bacterium]